MEVAVGILGYLAIGVFALSAPVSRVLGVEMILVLQFGFAGQAMMSDKEALM